MKDSTELLKEVLGFSKCEIC